MRLEPGGDGWQCQGSMRAETRAQDAKAQERSGVELVFRAPESRAQPVGEAGSGDAPGWGWTLGFWERAGRPGARVQKVPGGGYFPRSALGRRGGGAERRSPSTAGRGARISGARAKTREGAATELSFPSDPRFPSSPRPLHSPSLLTSPTPTRVTLPLLRLNSLTFFPLSLLESVPPHPQPLFSLFSLTPTSLSALLSSDSLGTVSDTH